MKRLVKVVFLIFAVCALLLAYAETADQMGGGVTVTASLEDKPVLVGDIPCFFPLAVEPTTLDILTVGYGGYDQSELYVWKKYREMTGVNVNWTNVDKAVRAEAVNNALLDGQPLDLIMRCKVSATRLARYGKSGRILDLAKDGLLAKNAPNCWAFLQSHPEALASVTEPDGAIYALPQVNAGAELRVNRKFYINKRWLANVGMGVPSTTEELYALLKAFKEQDANGNGDPGDEIPFCTIDWASLQEALFGAFGLANRGTHNKTVDCDEATGQARLILTADGYRDYLAYVRRLFAEGLIDPNIFHMTMQRWTYEAANDRVGMFSSTNLAALPADRLDDWVAVEHALEGPNGDRLWTAICANFHSTGAAILPATCKDPALVLRWLDYFWTDEGTLFYHMGVEGETFVALEDGSFDYAPAIYEEMKAANQTFDDVVARYSPYPGGSNPTVEIAPYFMGGEMAAVPAGAARSLFGYGPAEYWPSFTFTEAENDALAAIQADVSKYCDAARVEFVTGQKPLSDWDEYVAQVERLGAGELLRIYQAAIDRYAALDAACQ